MSEPPEKTRPSSRSSVSSTPPSIGGTSSARPPARSTERTYESGISAAGSVQTPHVASSAYAVIPMIGRMLLRFSPIALVVALAACGSSGGTKTVTVTETRTVTRPVIDTAFRLYFLRDGKVQPVHRGSFVPLARDQTLAAAQAALNQLTGSTMTSEEQIGLTSELARPDQWKLQFANGVMAATGTPQPRRGLAQVVYTLSQFEDVQAVEVNGKRYTRGDFEDMTPLILVESPLPFQAVHSPLHATGTANTF